jgi:hypothetical protein
VQKDRSVIGLVFAKEPPQREVFTASVQNNWFQIPPNAERHKVTSCWVPKGELEDLRASAAHALSRRGDGSTRSLIQTDANRCCSTCLSTDFVADQLRAQATARYPAQQQDDGDGLFRQFGQEQIQPRSIKTGAPRRADLRRDDDGLLRLHDRKAAVAKVDPKIYDVYVGRYDIGNNRVYVITREGDKLMTQIAGNPPQELFPETETQFFWQNIRGRLIFVKDEKAR